MVKYIFPLRPKCNRIHVKSFETFSVTLFLLELYLSFNFFLKKRSLDLAMLSNTTLLPSTGESFLRPWNYENFSK